MRRSARFLHLIGGLTLATILMTLTISFGIALLIPPPMSAGMSVPQALAALRDPAAAERVGLRRVRSCALPATPTFFDAAQIADIAAAELGVTRDRVRAAWNPHKLLVFAKVEFTKAELVRRDPASPGMMLPPFKLSLRQADDCWLTVSPLHTPIQTWRRQIFIAFLLTAVLLAPLTWWIARRLSRPLKRLALEARRVSLDDRSGSIPLEGAYEIRQAAAAMNAMQERLQAQANDMTHMLAAVAHDLRTPLTGLRLRAEMAPPATREHMVADIKRMNVMITQVLDYVHGRSNPEAKMRVDLTALVRDCIAEAQAAGGNVREMVLVATEAHVEPSALQRALDNLISNAVRYGGSARVSLLTDGDVVVLQVDDDGPGIPDDQIERLQEPFQRLEVSRSRETGGIGLGLAVARTAALSNGGRLVLRNRDGGGLCARIELPRDRPGVV
ncbi:MAG: ATP-binding protein [Pseudomonadota bacterium]|jgi:two-component system, OmpR family, sensor kinase